MQLLKCIRALSFSVTKRLQTDITMQLSQQINYTIKALLKYFLSIQIICGRVCTFGDGISQF